MSGGIFEMFKIATAKWLSLMKALWNTCPVDTGRWNIRMSYRRPMVYYTDCLSENISSVSCTRLQIQSYLFICYNIICKCPTKWCRVTPFSHNLHKRTLWQLLKVSCSFQNIFCFYLSLLLCLTIKWIVKELHWTTVRKTTEHHEQI